MVEGKSRSQLRKTILKEGDKKETMKDQREDHGQGPMKRGDLVVVDLAQDHVLHPRARVMIENVIIIGEDILLLSHTGNRDITKRRATDAETILHIPLISCLMKIAE